MFDVHGDSCENLSQILSVVINCRSDFLRPWLYDKKLTRLIDESSRCVVICRYGFNCTRYELLVRMGHVCDTLQLMHMWSPWLVRESGICVNIYLYIQSCFGLKWTRHELHVRMSHVRDTLRLMHIWSPWHIHVCAYRQYYKSNRMNLNSMETRSHMTRSYLHFVMLVYCDARMCNLCCIHMHARQHIDAGGRIDFERWNFTTKSASSNLQALSCKQFRLDWLKCSFVWTDWNAVSVGLTEMASMSIIHLEILEFRFVLK